MRCSLWNIIHLSGSTLRINQSATSSLEASLQRGFIYILFICYKITSRRSTESSRKRIPFEQEETLSGTGPIWCWLFS